MTIPMSLSGRETVLQMRIVVGRKRDALWVFGNSKVDGWRLVPRKPVAGYSSTLSSSFFLPQSAAACTKASTSGCGLFAVEDSCGWNSVAM